MVRLDELTRFLNWANQQRGGTLLEHPERPGYYEVEHSDGDWTFKDSFRGYEINDSQRTISFKGKKVWQMDYNGTVDHGGDKDLSRALNYFHERALLLSPTSAPYKGPSNFTRDEFRYESRCIGDISCFTGKEKITHLGKLVTAGTYKGGLTRSSHLNFNIPKGIQIAKSIYIL